VATGGSVAAVSNEATGGITAVASSGGTTAISGTGGTPSVATGGMTVAVDNTTTLTTDGVSQNTSDTISPMPSFTFKYEGAVTGAISLLSWWQNPDGTVREWGPVAECADDNAYDRILECVLNIPSGSRTFEFQVNLPDGGYWGDLSCNPGGGCGQTIGTVVLAKGSEQVLYSLNPNNTDGQPYYNGLVASVP
jgi:hypothetical protein